MNPIRSILLPLDGSPESAKSTACAIWLAETLDANLHVLYATAHPYSAEDALARLRVPQIHRSRTVLHQLEDAPVAAVLAAIATHRVDLVVMSALGETASRGMLRSRSLGSVAQAVLQKSPVPVLLLPMHYQAFLPWTSMLAATSGESAADRALEVAVSLASTLKLKLTVVHSEIGGAEAPFSKYTDAPHHEYSHLLEQLAERGLARCTAEQRACVQAVLLRHGNAATVLLEQAQHLRSSVLTLGWHGQLGPSRGLVLKRLLQQAECALLLVCEHEEHRLQLKVGSHMREK